MRKYLLIFVLFFPLTVLAELSDFSKGPVFEKYGENASIEAGLINPSAQTFKVAFDIYKENEGEGVLRGFNSVARFINMHVRAGVALENIDVAIVVHGKASLELMNASAYSDRLGKRNGSAELLSQLMEKGVSIYLCGQSASYHDISTEQLIEGVETSLSAMTSHALLQQMGFTLNPF